MFLIYIIYIYQKVLDFKEKFVRFSKKIAIVLLPRYLLKKIKYLTFIALCNNNNNNNKHDINITLGHN